MSERTYELPDGLTLQDLRLFVGQYWEPSSQRDMWRVFDGNVAGYVIADRFASEARAEEWLHEKAV